MQTEAIELVTVYDAAMERGLVKAQQRTPKTPPLAPVRDHAAVRLRRCAVRALLEQSPGQWWSIEAMARALRMGRRQVVPRVNELVYRCAVVRRYPPLVASGKAKNGVQVHRGQAQGYRWSCEQ